MIPINDIFDFLIVAGVLTLAVLAAVARRRIFRSNERARIYASDWLVTPDSPPTLRG
jgi:nitrate reductase gamma subunit